LIFFVFSNFKVRVIVIVDRPLLNIVEYLFFVFVVFARRLLLVTDCHLFEKVKFRSLEELRDCKVFVGRQQRHRGAVLSSPDLVKLINRIFWVSD
jgi:hypothetical protein